MYSGMLKILYSSHGLKPAMLTPAGVSRQQCPCIGHEPAAIDEPPVLPAFRHAAHRTAVYDYLYILNLTQQMLRKSTEPDPACPGTGILCTAVRQGIC